MRRVAFLLVACLPCLGAACGSGDAPPGSVQRFVPVQARFSQYDYVDYQGYELLNAPRGAIVVTFTAPSGVLLVNVVLPVSGTGDWQIKNLPVIASGVPQTLWIDVDLRAVQDAAGRYDIQSIDYACTLSALPLERAPEQIQTVPMDRQSIRFLSGIDGGPRAPPATWEPEFQFELPPVTAAADVAMRELYPNQEAGLGECAPTAVSNGLKFLHAGDGANEPSDCFDMVDFQYPGAPVNWPATKEVLAALPPYEVATVPLLGFLESAQNRIDHFRQVIQAIRDRKAVELSTSSHCVSVIAAAEVTYGTTTLYVLHVAHDIDQGHPGGTVIQTTLFDPFSAYALYHGGDLGEPTHRHFVIQTK